MGRPQPLELPSHDVLAQLASNDPQAYEALRREVITSFIENAPERLQSRLTGLQFRVDGVRRLSRSSPLGATLRIYKLMWESFYNLNQHWQELTHGPAPDASRAKIYVANSGARVLEFRPRARCSQ